MGSARPPRAGLSPTHTTGSESRPRLPRRPRTIRSADRSRLENGISSQQLARVIPDIDAPRLDKHRRTAKRPRRGVSESTSARTAAMLAAYGRASVMSSARSAPARPSPRSSRTARAASRTAAPRAINNHAEVIVQRITRVRRRRRKPADDHSTSRACANPSRVFRSTPIAAAFKNARQSEAISLRAPPPPPRPRL
jgi:hypothetical protein